MTFSIKAPRGNITNIIKKYKKDKNLPIVKKGSKTGTPPIQLKRIQSTTKIQNQNLCHGLKTVLLIKEFFIK
jgi:hypothetical protein